MNNNLDNKVIWVTGSSKGIGLSIAKKLKELTNAKIVISGTAPSAQYEMMGYYDRTFLDYDRVHYYPINLTKPDSIEFVHNNIQKDLGSIDILVNNAGVGIFKKYEEITKEDMKNTFDVNFNSIFQLTNLVLPKMKENKEGMIVNISSIAHFEKFKNSSIYAASKSALSTYGRTLREEVRNDNIKILNVNPGATYTNFWLKESLEQFGNQMMTSDDLALVIVNNMIMSFTLNLMIEDITIRPQNGDLS